MVITSLFSFICWYLSQNTHAPIEKPPIITQAGSPQVIFQLHHDVFSHQGLEKRVEQLKEKKTGYRKLSQPLNICRNTNICVNSQTHHFDSSVVVLKLSTRAQGLHRWLCPSIFACHALHRNFKMMTENPNYNLPPEYQRPGPKQAYFSPYSFNGGWV